MNLEGLEGMSPRGVAVRRTGCRRAKGDSGDEPLRKLSARLFSVQCVSGSRGARGDAPRGGPALAGRPGGDRGGTVR